jgi:hypothetical protein
MTSQIQINNPTDYHYVKKLRFTEKDVTNFNFEAHPEVLDKIIGDCMFFDSILREKDYYGYTLKK